MSFAVANYLSQISTAVTTHPDLALAIVTLLALAESLPVVGAIVPGTAVILSISALAGLGYLSIWGVTAAALAGAVLGDGAAFWLGYHYKSRALEGWPIRLYPALVERSTAFFAQHGEKSVALARFTPIVRAFVPLIAGASGMKPGRFYPVSIASAAIWAGTHCFAAGATGASIAAFHSVRERLPLELAVLAVLVVCVTAWALFHRRQLKIVDVSSPSEADAIAFQINSSQRRSVRPESMEEEHGPRRFP